MSLLTFEDLHVTFDTPEGVAHVVNGVSFEIGSGECVGIVGESGSGKSQTFMAAMGLLAANARTEGRILFRGEELLALTQRELNRYRGTQLAMIFQDPLSSLTPNIRIGRQLSEVLTIHRGLGRKAATARALEMLESVRISEPAKRMRQYPHELSGGMQQRVMIAMALLGGPAVIVADEPTTALDVTIQAEILDLFKQVQREAQTAIFLITHDLGVVAGICDRVVVMYAGRVVEEGTAEDIFYRAQHPYTQGLLGSTPRILDPVAEALAVIPGQGPSPLGRAKGCSFMPRCAYAMEKCSNEEPQMHPNAEGVGGAACHLIMKS